MTQDKENICECGRSLPENPVPPINNSNSRLQMYILDCATLFTDSKCRWQPYKYLSPAPPTRNLFTATLGLNEILLFGGLSTLNRREVGARSDDCTIAVKAKPSPSWQKFYYVSGILLGNIFSNRDIMDIFLLIVNVAFSFIFLFCFTYELSLRKSLSPIFIISSKTKILF